MDALRQMSTSTEEEARLVSRKVNKAMVGCCTESAYFQLFRAMQPSEAFSRGCVYFHEFVEMVRGGLHVGEERLSLDSLAAMWRYADPTATGELSTAGWLKMMRLGWSDFIGEQKRRLSRAPSWDDRCHVGRSPSFQSGPGHTARSPAWREIGPRMEVFDGKHSPSYAERCATWEGWHVQQRSESARVSRQSRYATSRLF
jgi:hypothetical protein